jgi:hypothetical protein
VLSLSSQSEKGAFLKEDEQAEKPLGESLQGRSSLKL